MIRKYAKRALDLSNHVPRIRSGSVRNAAVLSFSWRGGGVRRGHVSVPHSVGVVTKQWRTLVVPCRGAGPGEMPPLAPGWPV